MLTKNEILDFFQANKVVLESRFYCEKIGLFGSFARDMQTEKSDIDVIVEFKKDTPDLYKTEMELQQFISNRFNRSVDICAEKWIKPVFKNLVLKEVIYA